ncbi:MAG TPA: DsrE/DsrF/DrsH-like family protein [Vicinamibacteria bacterium]|nr:DsrE/DsrF/DrsH-like family protein [Vicinamibacteria bacterium]
MNANAPSVASDMQGLVAAEVERQVKALREEMDAKIAAVRERTVDDAATIVVFSGDLDKVLAGFVIATGAAAAGLETCMFFTFWGLSALKKKGASGGSKNVLEKMFAMMTPASSESLPTSKMNYFGVGAVMLRKMMKDKQIATLEELIGIARDMDVKMIACTMSMDAMGVSKEELVDGLTYGGVATYMADAVRSRVTLFI